MLKLTDVLDLLGALLLVVAVAVLVATWTAAGAIAAAGVGLLLVSWLVDRTLAGRAGGQS